MQGDHIVYSDVMHQVAGSFFWTSVRFRSVEEIDALIHALVALRGQSDDPDAHFHLQHFQLDKNSALKLGEITFEGPAFKLDSQVETRLQQADAAEIVLTTALPSRDKIEWPDSVN